MTRTGWDRATRPETDSPRDLQARIDQLEQKVANQRQLLEVIRALSGEMSLDILLGRIMEQATRVAAADRSSLFLYDRQTDTLWSKIAQGLDTAEIRMSAGQGLAGTVARTGEILNIIDAYQDPRFDREWDQKTGYRTRSVLVIPMVSRRGETIGVIQVLNKIGGGGFTREDEDCLGALATNAAVFIENAQLYEEIEELFRAFVEASITAIDERDPTTSGHSTRVAVYTANLARLVHQDQGPRFGAIHFTREQFRELRYASLLHDYGKIGVRESVLCKVNKLTDAELQVVMERLERLMAETRLEALRRQLAGESVDEEALGQAVQGIRRSMQLVQTANRPWPLPPEDATELRAMYRRGLLTAGERDCLSVTPGNLTGEEWEDMRSHVSRSYHLLGKIPWPEDLRGIPELSYAHHERGDGSGYPRRLRAEDIPLGGKMMSIADTYDALIAADRPYKKALTHERACEILRREAAAGRLDGDLVELFIEGRAWDGVSPQRKRSVPLVAPV